MSNVNPFSLDAIAAQRRSAEKAPAAEGDNPFSLANIRRNEEIAARGAVAGAVVRDPEHMAETLRLRRRYPAPVDVLYSALGEAQTQAKRESILEQLHGSAALTSAFGRDPSLAVIAQDDVDVLRRLETAVGSAVSYVLQPTRRGGLLDDVESLSGRALSFVMQPHKPGGLSDSLQAGQRMALAGAAHVAAGAAEWLNLLAPESVKPTTVQGQLARQFKAEGDRLDAESKALLARGTQDNLSAGVGSGVASAVQAAPAIGLALLGPPGLAAAGTYLALVTGGQAFGEARRQGAALGTATAYGVAQGGIERLMEMAPLKALASAATARLGPGALTAAAVESLKKDIPREQATTVLQDFNEWVTLNPGKSVAEFIAERPDAAVQTLIATVVAGGALTGVAGGLSSARDAVEGLVWREEALKADAEQLDLAFQLAAQSKTRERSPEKFQEAVEQLVPDAGLRRVYVDGEVLAQLPPEQLQQLPAEVVAAVPAAVQAGTTVQVPLAAALALANTPVGEVLHQNARAAPDAPSRAEKQGAEQRAAAHEEEMRRAALSVLEREQEDRDADLIAGEVASQIEASGRHSAAVARGMGQLTAQYFLAQSAKLRKAGGQDSATDLWAQFNLQTRGVDDPRNPDGVGQYERAPALEGLPAEVPVDGQTRRFGPFAAARNAAAEYMRAAGLPFAPPTQYAKADPERGRRIAAAFDAMQHAPNDPEVRAAYDALKRETLAQWQAIKGTGLRVEFNPPGKDPYGNPRNAVLDVVRNNHLWVFPTEEGFGQDQDRSDNPLLEVVEGELIDGREVTYNDVFRIVHDYFGHVKEGVGFRADGKENAWQQHAAMYSPLARRAMTTETRGQNSWVDFGPKAESNRKANAADTVYADQKTGLLPEWVPEEGFLGGRPDQVFSQRAAGDTRYQDLATAALGRITPPRRSAVALMRGEVKVPRMGTLFEIAEFFTDKNNKGMEDMSDPAALKKIEDALYADLLMALTDAGSAVGWYDAKVKAALDIFAEKHPELNTSEQARFGFIAMLAITSNQTKVNENAELADALYSRWKGTGVWPTDVGAVRDTRAKTEMSQGMVKINSLVARLGWERVREVMTSKLTPKEIHAALGYGVSGELADSQVYGATFLGPKIGAFFNNLYGNFDTVTMDRWWMRTVNRIRGSMLSVSDTFTEKLDALAGQLTAGAAEAYNFDVPRMQAEIQAYLALPAERQGEMALALETLPAVREYVKRRHADHARKGPVLRSDGGFVRKNDGTVLEKSYPNASAEGNLAKLLDLEFHADNQTPRNGADRQLMRKLVAKLQKRLRKEGIDMVVADIQAALWYYEKDLVAKLKNEQRTLTEEEPQDYETAARRVVHGAGDLDGPAGRLAKRVRAAKPPVDTRADTTGSLFQRVGLPDTIGWRIWTQGAPVVRADDVEGQARLRTGEPVVLEAYHGTITDAVIDAPRQSFFASPNPEVANDYTGAFSEPQVVPGAAVYPVFFRFKNPFVLDAEGQSWQALDMVPWAPDRALSTDELAREARARGYDGLVLRNVHDTSDISGLDPDTVYVALHGGAQVKSASGNDGRYAPFNPSVVAQQDASAPLGTFIPSRMEILLGKDANLSTYFHELGHFFLEAHAALASDAGAPLEIRHELDRALRWLGVGEQEPAAALTDFEGASVKNVLGLTGWAVLTAENPDAKQLSPEANAKRNQDLEEELRSLGLQYRKVAGRYGGPDESSFIVVGLSEDTALALGAKYGQESVLTRRGVVYPDGRVVPATGVETFDVPPADFFSKVGNAYFRVALDFNGEKVDAAPSRSAVWRDMAFDEKRPYHEKFARGFEAYLQEGKAPTPELQGLFRKIKSWMASVYGTLKRFLETQPDASPLNAEIRDVFGRMLAADRTVDATERQQALARDPEATEVAKEKLLARSLRDLRWARNAHAAWVKKIQGEAAELRKQALEEARAEVEAMPVVRAKRALDALQKDPDREALLAMRRDRLAFVQGYLRENVINERLPEGEDRAEWANTHKRALDNEVARRLKAWGDATAIPKAEQRVTDLDLAIVADSFGFRDSATMLQAIQDFGDVREAVEALASRKMLEEHGDLSNPEAVSEAADEAVHNEARARALATELSAQEEMLRARAATGGVTPSGKPATANIVQLAAKLFGKRVADGTPVRELRTARYQHKLAEAKAGREWRKHSKKAATEEAVASLRRQALNNAAVTELSNGLAEARKISQFFKLVLRDSDERLVEKGRDPDIVNAMRVVLGAYGFETRATKKAEDYLANVARYDTDTYSVVSALVADATLAAQPVGALTLAELRELHDRVRAGWNLAKESREYEVRGDALDRDEVAAELAAQARQGVEPTDGGKSRALTQQELALSKLRSFRAALTRVEQWCILLDGKWGGPFLRYVFQPVKEAADAYRTSRVAAREKYTSLVKGLQPHLTERFIDAPELGYTFGGDKAKGRVGHNGIGHAELLHAVLHTGNPSNKRKLLLGRGWATENEDGTLDTARWDAFIARMHDEGVLTKAHYDFAQGVWDLMESLKPGAQEAHRKVYGRYFEEIKAEPLVTPFGTYAGGYVPAQADARLVKDAKLREDLETENAGMALAFPTTDRGFTRSRSDGYARELVMDLRQLGTHLDKVLAFTHLQAPVRAANAILTHRDVQTALDDRQKDIYANLLLPWLSRTARQTVETPIAGDSGVSRWATKARANTGVALMMGNVINALQQVTGVIAAAAKVPPRQLLAATVQYVASPRAFKDNVATASAAMKTRMQDSIAELTLVMNDILLEPNPLERMQDWTHRHAYFLQQGVDNVLSPIVWAAAYNQAVTDKGLDDRDAVAYADSVIRQTQMANFAEDVSRIETGNPFVRIFSQFMGYFNMVANTNVVEVLNVIREQGLKKGAGPAAYVVMVGVLIPIWVAEAIALGLRGGPEDSDGDGALEEWMATVFGFGTLKSVFAAVPGVAQLAQLTSNRLNDTPTDDRISLSPSVSLLESAGNAPFSVYAAVADDGDPRKAVRDVAALVNLATGLPLYPLARPLGYAAGVAGGTIDPQSPGDMARGLVTGTPSPESRN